MWVGFALFLLDRYRRTGNLSVFMAGFVVVCIVLIKLVFGDADEWDFALCRFAYDGRPIGFLARFLDYGFVFGLLLVAMRWVRGQSAVATFGKVLKVAAIAVGFVYATLEVSTFFSSYFNEFQLGALSVTWAAFAIGFLMRGLKVSSKAYRYTGLVLFAVVTVKTFVYDLSDMSAIYYVLAAMLVGGLLLGGAFVYIRAGRNGKGLGESEGGGSDV